MTVSYLLGRPGTTIGFGCVTHFCVLFSIQLFTLTYDFTRKANTAYVLILY
jgi:hypothetical protein